MKIEQFVMAYSVEQDRLRALLPEGFFSLRPVLRINAEIRDDRCGYLELNTAAERNGKRGWLNIAFWNDIAFEKSDKTAVFSSDFLKISFTGTGLMGGCPAEKDNDGCFFTGEQKRLRIPEHIEAPKEFCDCSFHWMFADGDAMGKSVGRTIPAYPEEVKTVYQQEAFTAENAAKLPCRQVLGAYVVRFDRPVC